MSSSTKNFDNKNILDAVNKRRNFAIISHPDAGKTTLTEKLLLYGGAIQQAGAVKAADGSDAITLADTTGNVSFASSVTVTGDITVLGSQFIVNTEALKVEDPIIELGLVNSGGNLVAPSSDSNLDVGMIMHYYTGSTAKTAAVYWDDSAQRVAVASSVTENSNVMTEIVYANFEVGGLWVNDAAGQSQVIGHDGSNRVLQNITVDGGSF